MKDLPVGDKSRCFVIAEIGQNHQGDIHIAKELIVKAKKCGADCVKFQKSSLTDKFTSGALQSPYENPNSFGTTYGAHKAHLELSEDNYRELQLFSQNQGLLFSASAMDKESADFLLSLRVPFIKIGSGDTNNLPLVEHIAKSHVPIILSTGMQELETVKSSVDLVLKHHRDLVLLHCVSAYPTPYEDVNLAMIPFYKQLFPFVPVGYSGHELGIFTSVAAVALGAKVIERHFTLDKSWKGTDHACSLNPEEFRSMVQAIRQVEMAIGSPVKKIQESELPCLEKLGKSIVSKRRLECGTVLQASDLEIKVSRPRGIEPQRFYAIIGKVLNTSLDADVPLLIDHLIP